MVQTWLSKNMRYPRDRSVQMTTAAMNAPDLFISPRLECEDVATARALALVRLVGRA
jgi:hypothetical protein